MAVTSDFWTFSVTLFDQRDVEAACLELQARCDADVNMLLFCLWTDRLDAALLGRALVEVWPIQRDFIRPLRDMRRSLAKTGPEAVLREKVAAAELAAERFEQTALARLIKGETGPASLKTARAQLRAYAARLGADENDFLARAAPLLTAISRL